jgi:hypothetical protein
MQSLTRNEFLEVLGMSSGTFDQLQHSGFVALAFGMPIPATPGRYIDLDLVAMAISLGLTPSLGREIAAVIVAAYFNQWASAVGHAEADPTQNFFMAVGGVGWDAAKKRPKRMLVTNGTLDEISKDFQDQKELVGFFTINVSDIIRRLRSRAQEIGVDLSRIFFFPPNDVRFEQILSQVRRERDARVERLRRDRKKFAVAKARAHRKDIAAMPRVKNMSYPLALSSI